MNVYVYQAALLCEDCAKREIGLMRTLPEEGLSDGGEPYTDEELADMDAKLDTGDSGDYPQGPYPEGGGEADCPQHCDHCGVFLENPLTTDGYRYVSAAIAEARAEGRRDSVALTEWRPFYSFADDEEQAETENVLKAYGFWPKHLGG